MFEISPCIILYYFSNLLPKIAKIRSPGPLALFEVVVTLEILIQFVGNAESSCQESINSQNTKVNFLKGHLLC